MMKQRKTFEALNLCYKLGQIMCLFPISEQSDFKNLTQIITCGIFTSLDVAYFLKYRYNPIIDKLTKNVFNVCLSYFLITILFSYYMLILLSLIGYRHKWTLLFKKISNLNENLNNYEVLIYPQKWIKTKIFLPIMIQVVCSSMVIIYLENIDVVSLFFSSVITIRCAITILIFIEITNILDYHIKHLQNLLQKITRGKTYKEVCTRIFIIRSSFCTIYELFEIINVVFGKYIMLIISFAYPQALQNIVVLMMQMVGQEYITFFRNVAFVTPLIISCVSLSSIIYYFALTR